LQNANLQELSNAPNFMSFDILVGVQVGAFMAVFLLHQCYPLVHKMSKLPSALVLPGWRTMDACRTNCNVVLLHVLLLIANWWAGAQRVKATVRLFPAHHSERHVAQTRRAPRSPAAVQTLDEPLSVEKKTNTTHLEAGTSGL
jgi:hypothetical protein